MINIKSPHEIDIMREGGQILALLLDEFIVDKLEIGKSAFFINELCEKYIISKGAIPVLKGYRVKNLVFPYAICFSSNQEVVHGFPSKNKIINEGDIITIDVCIKWKGYFLDAARTYAIGKIEERASRLLDITEASLQLAISKSIVGNRIGDISFSIQNNIEKNGFSVVRDFCGHGIGRSLHEEPQVLNFGSAGLGPKVEEGMVLALEPIVNMGSSEVIILEDGWTVKTADNSLSCHFEDTIAVTSNGPEVLTRIKKEA